MIRYKGVHLGQTNACEAFHLASCYQEISGVRACSLLWMPIPCMICESLYPLSNFRRVVDSLPRKSARITLADRMMASPAVIMKERRICLPTVNTARAIGEPQAGSPTGYFFVASACQRTPCPATPESLGVDSGADVQFSVPMMKRCYYGLGRFYEQHQISKMSLPAPVYFKKQICL